MLIVIPTYGRANRQITWSNLPPEIKDQTLLIIQNREKHLYWGFPVFVLPDDVRDIATTRDAIVNLLYPAEKIVMLDDDMDFAVRRTDDPTKLRKAGREDLIKMFRQIDEHLNTFAHVGIASREGANRNTETLLYNTRMMRLLAYNTRAIKFHQLKFSKGGVMCDFYMTLALLRRGYQNCILNEYAQNQRGGSNAPGGCSETRTMEVQASAALNLAIEFPYFVTVVKKQTKTAWQGQERLDVRIQWKRAYEFGVLDKGARAYSNAEGECFA
jgi:hypothetical protein